MKSMKIIVNGKPFQVEIDDLGTSPLNVTVNGQSYEVTWESDEAAPKVAPAAAARPSAAAAPVSAAPARPAAPVTAAAGDALIAPMPGVVMDIAVKPGDKVTRGQQLCALEAMKMKNAIRCPKDAVISSIEVQDGQRVNYGDVLFKFSS